MSEKSVIDNIQKHYREFSPTERKVADCVLRHPNQVTEYTVKELAMASGVSEATVVRMCQHAGYTGYWPFRTMLARDMGMMGREEKRDNEPGQYRCRIYSRNMRIHAESQQQDRSGCHEHMRQAD